MKMRLRAFVTILIVVGSSGAAWAQAYEFDRVAAVGDPAPGTGETFTGFSNEWISPSGRIVFQGYSNADIAWQGIFSAWGDSVVPEVLIGDPAPPSFGGTFSNFSLTARKHSVNFIGSIAFVASVSGGAANEGVFMKIQEGIFATIAARGGPMGIQGSNFSYFRHPVIVANNRVVFHGTGTSAEGIFANLGGGTAGNFVVAGTGDAVPGGGGTFTNFHEADANDSLDVVFRADFSDSSSSGSGLFIYEQTSPGSWSGTRIALAGNPAPGTGGGTFDYVAHIPAINNSGHVLFYAVLSGGTSARGIFRRLPSGVIQPIALEGGAAPLDGAPAYAHFGGYSVADSGDVTFSASGAWGRGLFVHKWNIGPVLPIVIDKDPSPEGDGLIYLTTIRPSIGDYGESVFRAAVSGTQTPNDGIWRASPARSPLPVGELFSSVDAEHLANPSGVWEVGHRPDFDLGFEPYTSKTQYHSPQFPTRYTRWAAGPNIVAPSFVCNPSFSALPNYLIDDLSAYDEVIPARGTVLRAADGVGLSSLMWTAPSDGTYAVDVRFAMVGQMDEGVSVFVRDPLTGWNHWSHVLPSYPSEASVRLDFDFEAGERLEFAVGSYGGIVSGDATLVDVRIVRSQQVAVPSASAGAQLMLGLALVCSGLARIHRCGEPRSTVRA